MNPLSPFTDDDVKFMDTFGAYLTKHSKFSMKLNEILEFHKLLVKYNDLRTKVKNSVVGEFKIKEAQPEVSPKIVEKNEKGKK